MFERRLYFHVDWLLLGAVLLITGIGLAMIYSTTYVRLPDGTGRPGREFVTQVYALGLGGIALVACLMIDYRKLAEHSLFLYGALLAALVFVLLRGDSAGGAQRWIDVAGRFKIQPSEFARLTLALVLAMYFGENRRGARTPTDILVGCLFAIVPLLLIAKQPDLGTAVTLIPVGFGIAYLAGLRLRLVGIALGVAILLAPIAWKFALKEYQKSRIIIFLRSGSRC